MSNKFDLDVIVSGLVSEKTKTAGNPSGGKPKNKTAVAPMQSSDINFDDPNGPNDVMDPERQEATLSENYVEVPKNSWQNMALDTYIRYIDTKGQLKVGGRIIQITGEPNGGFNISITHRAARKGHKTVTWVVNSKDIQKIYKFKNPSVRKGGNDTATVASTPSATLSTAADNPREELLNKLGDKLLFDDNQQLRMKVESLESRVAKLEQHLKVLYTIIEKINVNNRQPQQPPPQPQQPQQQVLRLGQKRN